MVRSGGVGQEWKEYLDLLARAEVVARHAHQGQVDKAGVDYTEHLRAVADMCETEREKTVAWLHDTIEDTPLGLHDLEAYGFGKTIVKAVGILTHTHEHSHADYIRVIRDAEGPAGDLARAVKRADLRHNSDPTRSDHMPPAKLLERYQKSVRILDGIDP